MAFNILNKLKNLINEPKFDSAAYKVYAPLSGEVIPVSDVPDVVFSEKIAGDGVAIKPTGDTIVAPVDGTVSQIFETNHCVVITSINGLEIMVHFGIDTVELQGKGFERVAKVGDTVKVGDPLIKFDLEFLEKNAKTTITPVVISNFDFVRSKDTNHKIGYYEGHATAGVTQILSVSIDEKNDIKTTTGSKEENN